MRRSPSRWWRSWRRRCPSARVIVTAPVRALAGPLTRAATTVMVVAPADSAMRAGLTDSRYCSGSFFRVRVAEVMVAPVAVPETMMVSSLSV